MDKTSDIALEMFLQAARKSRLFDNGVLERAMAKLKPATSRGLAAYLIQSGDLTHFQAEKLLKGHWRGLAVGPYRLLTSLGRGGMAKVYLAQDSRLSSELGDQTLVALKVLPPRAAMMQQRKLDRFLHELELGRKTSHPNVARTLAGGDADGVHFIAMEYVPGKTLRQIVIEGGKLSVGDAARVFADVAAGLTHLHERGIIHRDLKPANIMVMPDGKAKILDLGLALAPLDPRSLDPVVFGGERIILGTMDFIAPEQAKNAMNVTPRSDLYSLGCSLYYALSGTQPFPGGTSQDKIRWQRNQEPAPIAEFNPIIPQEFIRIIESLMAKDPTARPVSAKLVQAMLLSWASAPIPPNNLTLKEKVLAVDCADSQPQLWTDDSEQSEIPDDETPPNNYAPQWLLVGGIAVCLLLFMLFFSILRRL